MLYNVGAQSIAFLHLRTAQELEGNTTRSRCARGVIMDFDYLIGADKSAVAAINRALQLVSGLFCQNA
jgi:hypothetical protein